MSQVFGKIHCYILAIESADPNGLEGILNEMNESVKRKYSIDSSFKVIDTNYKYPWHLGNALKFYFTDLFEGLDAKYYVKKDGYFFFANNPKILISLKKHWDENTILIKEENYADFDGNLAPNSNLELLI